MNLTNSNTNQTYNMFPIPAVHEIGKHCSPNLNFKYLILF
uniref:Uncharacterized protein n=1 Tax=Anguilla anguilla TaxID=7936 RepID=A0A0E9QMZ0_ANGAN